MVEPVLIYCIFNRKTGTAINGWAISTATDSVLPQRFPPRGKRVPALLKIFVTAVAIAGDFGATVVIALFISGSDATADRWHPSLYWTKVQ
jgi:Na+:H+ antiporter, NhaA family